MLGAGDDANLGLVRQAIEDIRSRTLQQRCMYG